MREERGVWDDELIDFLTQFLNAFWEDFASEEAEKLWNFVNIASQIAKEAGTELDEMEAHRFLEKADEAHTVLEMRARLRNTGAIGANERPKTVPLSHYLLFKYDSKNAKLFYELVTRAQGSNQKQIEKAQAKLDAVSAAFDEASRTADAAAASLKEAISRENDAKRERSLREQNSSSDRKQGPNKEALGLAVEKRRARNPSERKEREKEKREKSKTDSNAWYRTLLKPKGEREITVTKIHRVEKSTFSEEGWREKHQQNRGSIL